MVKTALGYLSLFRALYFAKRAKVTEARAALDLARARLDRKNPEFLEAFDARILMMEGRGDEARDKLSHSIDAMQSRSDHNAQYISLYCEHFLRLYDRNSSAREIKSEAGRLSPGGYLPAFLPFFNDDALSRVIEQ